MNPMEWISKHKIVVGLFGAAVAGYVLYSYFNKSNSSGTASPLIGGNATQAMAPQYLVPVVQSGLSPQSLAQTSANPLPASTSTTPTTNTPSPLTPAFIGGGYNAPSSGFSQIGGAPAYMQAIQSGQSVYYQPAVGVFDPVSGAMANQIISGGTPFTNTPTFLKVS